MHEHHDVGETHDVFNQSSPVQNYNSFTADLPLQEAVARYGGEHLPLIQGHGQRCGDAEVIQWGFDANEFPPRFDSHDRFGHRIDVVRFHPAYHKLMAMALANGLHCLPWREQGSGAHVARAALSYMQTQVEAGHGCPLTMTFASVPTIKLTESVAARWLPKILAQDYQPENVPFYEKSAVTIGMGMTEKQGGSDVRANTSRAVALSGRGSGALYSITGHKWFLSAPMCDAFLMLAQADKGLSCFLVPRWREDGVKNGLLIQRLKSKMGNVSNASSEVEMRGAHGWMIGEEGRGVAAIIEMVALTRFDCMIGSTAGQRQAVLQAYHHCSERQAFGGPLLDKPLMRNVLADLQLEVEGSLALSMRMARALDKPADSHEQMLLRLGTAVGKLWICKRTPAHAYEAMECLGGNGVIENSIMPRLYREAPINAIWEGSGNVQALDILRAVGRAPAVLEHWLAEIEKSRGLSPPLDKKVVELKRLFSFTEQLEFRGRYLAEQLALTMQAALLLQGTSNAVAEAFIQSRLQTPSAFYGELAASADVDAILARIFQPSLQ